MRAARPDWARCWCAKAGSTGGPAAWPAGDGGWRVRTATEEDIPAIVELLDRDHRARPFGYRYDQGEMEHRLARWPGMTLERTYLAFDPRGRLGGMTSAWDPAAVK